MSGGPRELSDPRRPERLICVNDVRIHLDHLPDYDLGRFREACRHLRYYAELAPAGSWNWCWYGKAAQAIGELGEVRAAYHRAIELEPSDQETDAAELLDEPDEPEEDAA